MTYTTAKILAECQASTKREIDRLEKYLETPIYILDTWNVIKTLKMIDVLNLFSSVVNTPMGTRFEFFYEDGAVRQWFGDRVMKVKETDPARGYILLLDFALKDLDDNAHVTWSWDKADLEALLEEQE